jgi:SagB-type dehydrogenase family enzyme
VGGARAYHDTTKHHFHGFARSLGYLDWATQPDPFRRYSGALLAPLPREPFGEDQPYHALFDASAAGVAVTNESIGEFLRCSLGLSAWKQSGASRWALRVNPSSGNLHPTEGYVVWNGHVSHYAPDVHALETRCRFSTRAWPAAAPSADSFFVALASITWREAWKYGERAYRYCQHDVGHALGALRLSAARLGWRLQVLPRWSDDDLAQLLGLDRDDDFNEGEREEPDCVAVVTRGDAAAWLDLDPRLLAAAAAGGTWYGAANRLSQSHVEWPRIDEVVAACRYPGTPLEAPSAQGTLTSDAAPVLADGPGASARTIILGRRSAVAFDGRSTVSRARLLSMLERLQPPRPPWDAVVWPPQVHLAMFVHRVEGLQPGMYAYLRDDRVVDEWRTTMRQEFLWEEAAPHLFLLAPLDVRQAAMQISCNQEIAGDGFFSLGMIARFDASLAERGDWFYRRLFWECGLIGQVLYLEAEAAGARSTGIGCFFDDPVHEMFGLTGQAWQSLYHFSMGVPVDDMRLTTTPGYAWDQPGA